MVRRGKEFSEEIKIKCLLWSDRHCCLCDRACGTNIEIAHIDPRGGNDLDNAIPLCYEHHAEIGRYNKEHPRGNKYRFEELKKRRDQIYERHTRHLVPAVQFAPNQTFHTFPEVGFEISNLENTLAVKARIEVNVYLGGQDLGPIQTPKAPYYSGGLLWNLNPRHTISGHFPLPTQCANSNGDIKLEIKVTLIDIYERSHPLLPVCYSYVRANAGKRDYWYAEPTSYSEFQKLQNTNS